jgi:apolipoprotein N-acyltransferase
VEDAFAMIRAPAVPILTGALVQGQSAQEAPGAPPAAAARVSNSALLFDAGRLVGRYDKHHLLPFSESLPLEGVFPSLRALSPHSGNFAPGSGLAPLALRGHPMAVFICYEDLFPHHVRALTTGRHAELLVNVTNDSWFAGTDEPWVHMALARLRAVEQRKYLVRATLSGKSVVFDPVGREIGTLPEDQEGSFLAEARWLPGSTVYDRIGDVPWWLFVAGTLAYALWRRLSGAGATGQDDLWRLRKTSRESLPPGSIDEP